MSLIVPIVSIIVNKNYIYNTPILRMCYEKLHCKTDSDLIVIFGVVVIGFYIFRTLFIAGFTYSVNGMAYAYYKSTAVKAFHNIFFIPFSLFIARNSADVWKVVAVDTNHIAVIISSCISLCAEFLVVALLYIMLLFTNWKMTLALTVVFGVKIVLIVRPLFKKVAQYGEKIGIYGRDAYKSFNESYDNYRLIKLIGGEHYQSERFKGCYEGIAHLTTLYLTIQNIPRLLMEAAGVISIISMIIYATCYYENMQAIVPIVSMYAIAFYRFLPSVMRIITCYNQIIYAVNSIGTLDSLLLDHHDKDEATAVVFDSDINLVNVSFCYRPKQCVFDQLCLTINKGERVAILGHSGSGKSTLLDIILGFYGPTSGSYLIDDKAVTSKMLLAWRKKIGYVPQQIYLFDGSIAENVVFGRNYNENRLVEVLKQTDIYDTLLAKDGINTQVGENGVFLSGGQKQRIALARALYSNPEVIILDEATSALDNETERRIIADLWKYYAEKTIVVVSHRMSIVEQCDVAYVLREGMLTRLNQKSCFTDSGSARANLVIDD